MVLQCRGRNLLSHSPFAFLIGTATISLCSVLRPKGGAVGKALLRKPSGDMSPRLTQFSRGKLDKILKNEKSLLGNFVIPN